MYEGQKRKNLIDNSDDDHLELLMRSVISNFSAFLEFLPSISISDLILSNFSLSCLFLFSTTSLYYLVFISTYSAGDTSFSSYIIFYWFFFIANSKFLLAN